MAGRFYGGLNNVLSSLIFTVFRYKMDHSFNLGPDHSKTKLWLA